MLRARKERKNDSFGKAAGNKTSIFSSSRL
jgi:hypothetical protein